MCGLSGGNMKAGFLLLFSAVYCVHCYAIPKDDPLSHDAIVFYKEKWTNVLSEARFYNDADKKRLTYVIENTGKTIKIKRKGNLAVISHPAISITADMNLDRETKDLWYCRDGKWLIEEIDNVFDIEIKDYNHDDVDDVLVFSGCCDSVYLHLYKNLRTAVVKTQELHFIGTLDRYEKNGRSYIEYKPYEGVVDAAREMKKNNRVEDYKVWKVLASPRTMVFNEEKFIYEDAE